MDEVKPKQQNNQTTDLFNDALDEFPFYHQINPNLSLKHPNSLIKDPNYQNSTQKDQNSSLNDQNSSQKHQNSNLSSRIRRRSLSHRFRDETTFDLNSNDINKDDLVTKNDLDTKSDMGIERKKGIGEKIDNLVDGNEKDLNLSTIDANKDDLVAKKEILGVFDTKYNFNSLVKEIKEDFDTKKKEFGENIENNLNLSSNSVNMGTKDLETNSFMGFDYTYSEDRKIRSFEELNGNFKGKGDNFELSSGEISGNFKGKGDDFELSSGEISGNSKGKGDDFELSSDEISGNSKGKGSIFKLSSGEISGNFKGKGDDFELSSGEISGNSKGKRDNFELSSGEISSNSVIDSASTKSRGCSNTESFDYNASEKRKKRFAKKLDVLKEKKENNHVNVKADRANDDELVVNESSSGFLLGLTSFVIKAIGWQLSLLVTFVIYPIKFVYKAYMFVSDPFQIKRRIRSTLYKIFRVVFGKFVSIAGKSLKDHQSMSELALRFGRGFLWAVYVCTVLVTLLISGFLLSGVFMRKLVDEPIQMKEALTFDYTKDSPVAFVPIIYCPVEPYDVPFGGKSDVGDIKSTRVIPRNHKLQATVALVLPESDYNRNLGVFQVRLDLLSVNGRTLATMRHPSMLHFSSQPIRMLLTFFKVAPLVTGYSSESQTLNINLRGLTEGDIPTACLRVIIEQRAEFRPGAGIPEIYDASLTLESELPLVKKLMWLWKKTLFIWLGLSMFTMQLLLALVCCRPLIWPKGRVAEGSAGNIALQNDHPAQR